MISKNMNNVLSLFILSPATIIFAILSIAIFIYYGAKGLFYAFVFITIVVGIINAWAISRIDSNAEDMRAHRVPPRDTARRKATRKHAGAGRNKVQRKIKR